MSDVSWDAYRWIAERIALQAVCMLRLMAMIMMVLLLLMVVVVVVTMRMME
jgi:hypothetical protein